jgi:transketolase N-terminal domain/subunit
MWSYRAVTIQYGEELHIDGKKRTLERRDWYTKTDGHLVVGIQAILEPEGANGWELVSALPEQTSLSRFEVTLLFKRPRSQPKSD